MKLTAQNKSNGEFRVTVESYDNEDISENVSSFERKTYGYSIDKEFKESLIETLRDVADFERVSLAELLSSFLYVEEKEEIVQSILSQVEYNLSLTLENSDFYKTMFARKLVLIDILRNLKKEL